jgi:hypothetical protein
MWGSSSKSIVCGYGQGTMGVGAAVVSPLRALDSLMGACREGVASHELRVGEGLEEREGSTSWPARRVGSAAESRRRRRPKSARGRVRSDTGKENGPNGYTTRVGV